MTSQKLLVKEKAPVTTHVSLVNPNISVTNSVEFMKKMVVVSLSSIAFLRGIFPSDVFTEKLISNQRVHVLKASHEIPGTTTMIGWIKSGFDLVHSHHLKKLMLIIAKKNVVLEVYTFNFSYDHEAINCDVMGEIGGKEVLLEQSQGLPEDISQSVRHLMRSILTHSTTLSPLPNGCGVSMRLIIDEEIPADLVPKFFEHSDDDKLKFPFEAETLKLGKVQSKYTTFSVSAKSSMNRELDSEELLAEDEIPPQEDSDEIVLPSPKGSSQARLSQFIKINPTKNIEVVNNSSSSVGTNLSDKLSMVSLQEKRVCCICECSDVSDEIIKCSSCSLFQHKVCYKLQKCHQVDSHICVNCHNPGLGKTCTVPDLLSDNNRKEGALYRQALMVCCNNTQVSCNKLITTLKVPRRMAEKLMQRLDSEGCFEPSINKGGSRRVKEGLKENILDRHFSQPNCSDNQDMETEPSSAATVINVKVNENVPHEQSAPQPKRRKILSNIKNL
ncbi:HORMA domain-containing protein 1-like isoform X2 [Macrosteles quadrilineatus]|uniref:HORMA domain-containing protein 1-like isoform X2 n=1 Tax=Macrosteles quadrilineatus TaxID=74068 RepID=UPI0023E19041|nr:HORMA domain-containing protein 1-like isoform X2 [Macrosteles quadrilineatus]